MKEVQFCKSGEVTYSWTPVTLTC